MRRKLSHQLLQRGDKLIDDFIVSCADVVRYTSLDVVCEQLFRKCVERRVGCRDLYEDVRAVGAFFSTMPRMPRICPSMRFNLWMSFCTPHRSGALFYDSRSTSLRFFLRCSLCTLPYRLHCFCSKRTALFLLYVPTEFSFPISLYIPYWGILIIYHIGYIVNSYFSFFQKYSARIFDLHLK